jgi:hypothetical protein
MPSPSDPTQPAKAAGPLLQAKRTASPDERRLARGEVVYWVSERTAAPASSEKRGSDRTRTRLRSGRIFDAGNQLLAECFLYDRSSKGWRLRLLEDVPLPPRFRFFDDEFRRAFDATLVWRRDREVGIRLRA